MQDLLDLALASPEDARRRATQLLASDTSDRARSYAHQCLGIVLRDSGATREALRHLRTALQAADATSDLDRVRDVRATYGGTLVYAGRTHEGIEQFDRALSGATGELRAKIRMRKAGVLTVVGRHEEARPVLREALAEIASTGNVRWEARTRAWLGNVELRLGQVEAADRELTTAERIFREQQVTFEQVMAVQTLAEIAVARGDLATGLRRYADAVRIYRVVGHPVQSNLLSVYASAYLAAGLAEEAVALLETVDVDGLDPMQQAELHLLSAKALLVAGDAARALPVARQALAMFRRQQREWFELRARLVSVRIREALGDSRGLAREARHVAEALHDGRADEAPEALTIAGRLARGGDRIALWRAAASYRERPSGLVRAGAWLARALEREQYYNRGGVLRACAAGLGALDEQRRMVGSAELRAVATTHGRELTKVALRHAVHEPRSLLRWSERTRATTLAQPPATSDAATIPESLAALRDNGRRLAEARQAGEPTAELESERLRHERAVRAEHHTLPAAVAREQRPVKVEEIVNEVGDGCLVELVDVDGTLHVLVVHDGRVRRRVAGTTAEVAGLLGPAQMLLRRASRGRPASTADLGRRLQEAILGDAARLIPEGPVVLAPTARLHGLPWALIPTLNERSFTVVPSAGQWLRARAVRRPRPRRTLLVAGPALESGGAEVPVLAKRLADAILLDGPAATVEAVLEGLDGADLAHLAAHGRFRADSPLFSALDMADGPLTVHELERLRRAPYRVVLSACESGVLAPVGAEELLGLAAALFSIGTAGLVCSVAEVNDAATAQLMVGLHDALARGDDPASALLAVRQAAADDPVAAGTAAAFVALGV